MTGVSIPGVRGFVTKDHEPFDARLNVKFHRYLLIEAGSLLRSGESLADFVRAAVREKDSKGECPMMFSDLEGDTVETTVLDQADRLVLELSVANGIDAIIGYSAWLDVSMARALAAELLSFADSSETQRCAITTETK